MSSFNYSFSFPKSLSQSTPKLMLFSKNKPKKGPGCIVPEIIEHEFLHAMGMMHEQSRPDRDNFLKINWGNIKEEYHSQYFMMHSSFWDNQGYKL